MKNAYFFNRQFAVWRRIGQSLLTDSRRGNIYLLLISLLFFYAPTSAQKTKGGAGGVAVVGSGGSGAKTSTTSASGGTSVSGFAYKLPFGYHLEYKTVRVQIKMEYSKIQIADKCYTLHQITDTCFIAWTFDLNGKIASAFRALEKNGENIYFHAVPNNIPPLPKVEYEKVYWGEIERVHDSLTCVTFAPSCCSSKKDTVVLTTVRKTVMIDTIDRYYDVERSWLGALFGSKRLRVSIVQADSGKLKVQFKRTQFPASGPITWDNLDFRRYLPTGEVSAAVPISISDSIQNFSLAIASRNLVGQTTNYASLPYSVLQYGAVTIPFKYRFHNNRPIGGYTDKSKLFADTLNALSESTSSFNLAMFVGKKWGRTQFYYDATQTHNTVSFMAAGFAGPSLFSLAPNNVNKGTDLNKYPSQQIALSAGAAFTLEWRSLNLGFFYGWDIPVERSPWVYRYKGWLGFGIGFSLGMFTNSNSQSQIGSQ